MKKIITLIAVAVLASFALIHGIDANEEPIVVPLADEETHIVAFDPADGVTTYPEMFKTTVEDGGLITDIPANPTRLGYFFKGWAWSYDASDQPVFWDFATDVVTENTTLWAEWEEGAIVTFDPDDGVTTYPDFYKTTVALGDKVTDVPANPTRLGYFFKGWASSYDANDQPVFWDFATDVVTDNTTLWAEWEQGAIVAFDPNDGVTTYPDFYKTTVVLGDKVTDVPANPTRPGYVFKGWAWSYDANDQPVFWDFATDVVTDNTTLWAEWTEAYIVGFDRNDGRLYSYDEITKVVVGAGERITQLPANPTRPGYVFAGWTVNSDNEDKGNRLYWDFATETVNHNLMLYASWDAEEAVVNPETNVNENTSSNNNVSTGDNNRMLMPTMILISAAALSVLGLLVAKKKLGNKE